MFDIVVIPRARIIATHLGPGIYKLDLIFFLLSSKSFYAGQVNLLCRTLSGHDLFRPFSAAHNIFMTVYTAYTYIYRKYRMTVYTAEVFFRIKKKKIKNN